MPRMFQSLIWGSAGECQTDKCRIAADAAATENLRGVGGRGSGRGAGAAQRQIPAFPVPPGRASQVIPGYTALGRRWKEGAGLPSRKEKGEERSQDKTLRLSRITRARGLRSWGWPEGVRARGGGPRGRS